jgi:hypothetical protein
VGRKSSPKASTILSPRLVQNSYCERIDGWNPLVEPFPNLKTVSPDSIHNSRNCSPKFGTVSTTATTPTSNYFESVQRWRNPRVPLCSSCLDLRPSAFHSSIRPSIHRQSMTEQRKRGREKEKSGEEIHLG